MTSNAGASFAPDDVAVAPNGTPYALVNNADVDAINSDGTVSQVLSYSGGNTIRRFGVASDGDFFLEGYYSQGVLVAKPNSTLVTASCNTGEGPAGIAVSINGTGYALNDDDDDVCSIQTDGQVREYSVPDQTSGLALDQSGNLWTVGYTLGSDAHGNTILTDISLVEFERTGEVRTVATNLPPTTAPEPTISSFGVDLALDRNGDVFFTDNSDYIYEWQPDGTITTVAGTGQPTSAGQSNGDGGPATSAAVEAGALALDPAGDLYFVDQLGQPGTNGASVREIVGASTVGASDPRVGPTSFSVANYPTHGSGPTEVLGGTNPSELCACTHAQLTENPVDTATGAFWHTFTDMSTAGRGPSLEVSRTYDSTIASQESLFGYGWSSLLTMSANADVNTGDITINQEDGSQVAFAPQTGGGYAPLQPRELATLTQNPDGSFTFVRRQRETFTFNAYGQLTSVADLNGNTMTLGYDQSGDLDQITAADGRSYAVTTTNGLITKIVDGDGRTCTYTYDDYGNLISATDPTGATWTFTYDSSHNLLSMLDPDQQGTAHPSPLTNTYDSSGRVITQTDFAGRETTFDYTSISGATKTTDPAGDVTVDYYTNGQRTKTTVGYGTSAAATTTYTYDPSTGGVASITDPRGNATSYTYDAAGDTLSVTDALNRQSTSTYDSLGDVLTSTDPAGVTTTNTYDAHGSLLSTSTPLTNSSGTTVATRTTTYVYGDSANPGLPTSVTDPDGNTTTMAYDSYGDLTSSTGPATAGTPNGAQTTDTYDLNTGWLLSTVAPRGNVSGGTPGNYLTTDSYDADGRTLTTRDPLWSSTAPTLHQTSSTYDADGDVLTSTDGDGNTTSYTYDLDGERTVTTRADGTPTTQTWTADGMPATYTDAAGDATTSTYDARNDVITSTDPQGHVTTYSYDADGDLTLTAKPGASCSGTPTRGCIGRSYDADDELTAVTYLDGATPNVTGISYDADGRRTAQSDGSGSQTWTYDDLGRLVKAVDGTGAVTSYGYDLDGDTTQITYPSGRVVTRAFDAAGDLTAVSDGSGNTSNFGYDADGDNTTIAYPSGTGEQDSVGYDANDQITTMSDTQTPSGGSASTLAGFTYSRDGNEQVTASATTGSAALNDPAQTYTYNALNQLTGSGASGGTANSYDAAGNITGYGQSATSTQSAAYNADGQTCWTTTATVSNPTCGSVPSSATSYGYDSDGNRTTTSTPASATTGATLGQNTYDEADQLTTTQAGAQFVPMTPTRIYDTASGSGYAGAGSTLAAGGTATVQVAGVGGVPSTGVSAVIVNITTLSNTAATSITAYPSGATQPTGVTLYARASTSINDTATLTLNSTGKLSVTNSAGTLSFAVDVEGYYTTTPASGGSQFVPIAPTRIADTLSGSGYQDAGQHLSAGGSDTVQVTGQAGVPAGASGAVVEVSQVTTTAAGGFTLYPAGSSTPSGTSISFSSGVIATREAVVKLGSSPAGAFTVLNTGSGTSDVVVDLVGYYVPATIASGQSAGQPAGQSTFQTLPSTRVIDTRTGSGLSGAGQHIAAGGTQTFSIAGLGGVPSNGATAVTVLLSETSGSTGSKLVAYPGSGSTPVTATLHWQGVLSQVQTSIPLSATGTFTVAYSGTGTADLTIDVLGYTHGPDNTYTYNGDGQRTASTNAATVANHHYVYDNTASTPLLLDDGTDTFIYGPDDLPLEQIDDITGTVTYLHHDQLGNTRLITSSAGSVVGTYTYTAYGQVSSHAGAGTPLQYGSGYTDSTGFVYLQHRYYDPGTTQFLSMDPMLSATRESYTYVSDSPTDGIDPLGLCWPSWACGFEHAIGHALSESAHYIGKHYTSILDILGAAACIVATAGQCALIIVLSTTMDALHQYETGQFNGRTATKDAVLAVIGLVSVGTSKIFEQFAKDAPALSNAAESLKDSGLYKTVQRTLGTLSGTPTFIPAVRDLIDSIESKGCV